VEEQALLKMAGKPKRDQAGEDKAMPCRRQRWRTRTATHTACVGGSAADLLTAADGVGHRVEAVADDAVDALDARLGEGITGDRKERSMFEKSCLLACGLLLVLMWPASAQLIKGVISVTGGEMP
jgi:hypothetical protein